MARTVKPWVGKNDDSMPPPSVRLRIFNKYEGKCYISGEKIKAGDSWELDHVTALCNGGENTEENLAPVLKEVHKKKTNDDKAFKAKVDRLRQKHFGIKSEKKKNRFSKRYDRETKRWRAYDLQEDRFV